MRPWKKGSTGTPPPDPDGAEPPAPKRGLVRKIAYVALGGAGFAATVAVLTHFSLRVRLPCLVSAQFGENCVDDVEFPSVDGTTLRGWFVRAPEPRGVLLLCHGYLMTRRALMPIAQRLNDAGYSLLIFDFRGTGRSSGRHCTFGYREAEDVRGAVRYLESREDCRDLPLGGVGLSMGGVALLLAAPECPEFKAIVCDGVYPTLTQAIRRRCDMIFGPAGRFADPVVRRVLQRQIGVDPREVSPVNVVAELAHIPTLFIHADRDWYLGVREAEELYEASAEPKAMVRFSRAFHCGGLRSDLDEYSRNVLEFLEAHGF